MSFMEGNLHDRVDALERENAQLRELAGDLVARIQAVEPICEMAILDARFVNRIKQAGVEVDE